MPWSRRQGRAYYSRSYRMKGQVVKKYVGGGWLGNMAARADAERREKRAALERAQREVQMAIADALNPLEQLAEWTRLLVTATPSL